MLQELSKTVLVIVAGLLPIINPPASAFIMLSMLPHATAQELREVARRVAVNSLVLLLASLLIGAYVLSFFGISIPVLRVAGGLVVAMAGWNLLQSPDEAEFDGAPQAAEAHRSEASLRSKAFYPLTLPITVGPGSISVAIALGTGSPEHGLSPGHLLGVVIGLLIVTLSIYLCLRFAARLERMLGAVGTQVVMRLFAFVIFCIGVQIIWLGVSGLLKGGGAS